jgi:hypothetical protein
MDPKIIQSVVAPAFLLIGLSHLLQPQLWVRFFEVVRQSGVAAAIIPMYTLPIALVLVAGHNVWTWDWPLFLTVAGWAMTIKSALYLMVPRLTDRMLERKMVKSGRSFQMAGATMVFFGAVLTWQSWNGI